MTKKILGCAIFGAYIFSSSCIATTQEAIYGDWIVELQIKSGEMEIPSSFSVNISPENGVCCNVKSIVRKDSLRSEIQDVKYDGRNLEFKQKLYEQSPGGGFTRERFAFRMRVMGDSLAGEWAADGRTVGDDVANTLKQVGEQLKGMGFSLPKPPIPASSYNGSGTLAGLRATDFSHPENSQPTRHSQASELELPPETAAPAQSPSLPEANQQK